MLKLVYCGWIAALVRESLIERSNTSSRPVQLTDVSGPQFDLRADLSGANLCITILPHVVYQFFVGKYNAVATSTELRIGCEVQPVGRLARRKETPRDC